MSTALITGITGQDGYYLSKLLLEKGYTVHGTIRRTSTFNTSRIEELISKYRESEKLQLHFSDLLDSTSLNTLINTIKPDEVYNLAAQSHVGVSFKNPAFTYAVSSTPGETSFSKSEINSSPPLFDSIIFTNS